MEKETEVPSDSGRDVRRAVVVGLILNLALSVLKAVAGWLGGSRAVVADAVHSLSDGMTDVAILVASRFWNRPPDDTHPYGHRRIETMITVGIGVLLVSAAAGLVGNAFSQIRHATASPPPGKIALIAAIISVVLKEWMYRWTMRKGRIFRSPALQANAWHHRSDALSSIPVVVAVGGSMLFPSMAYLDAAGTLIVAVFIFQSAWKIAWPGLRELSEGAAPEPVQREIGKAAGDVDGVKEVHRLRTRYIGARLLVDLHVLVDGAMTVDEGHAIASEVSTKLRSMRDVSDVIVHVEPIETSSLRGVHDEDIRF